MAVAETCSSPPGSFGGTGGWGITLTFASVEFSPALI